MFDGQRSWENGCFWPANEHGENQPQSVLGSCAPPSTKVHTYVTYRYVKTPLTLRQSKTLNVTVNCP